MCLLLDFLAFYCFVYMLSDVYVDYCVVDVFVTCLRVGCVV